MPSVHLADTVPATAAPTLCELLGAGWTATAGQDSPPETSYLIAGRPSPESLDHPALKALIIPYAGLLAPTRAALLTRPALRAYNLHHHAPVVAEFALTLLLAVARQVIPLDQKLRRGVWASADGVTLAGKRVLIVGFGHVGRALAPMLRGLGCEVCATRRRADAPSLEHGVHVHPAADLDALLPGVDAVVVAAPLTVETSQLLGERQLNALPPGALLVNIARGELVDEDALYAGLVSGHLGGAGLDVWYRYPPDARSRQDSLPAKRAFWELDNVVMSPHRAGRTAGSQKRRVEALVTLLGELEAGRRPRPIDVRAGY